MVRKGTRSWAHLLFALALAMTLLPSMPAQASHNEDGRGESSDDGEQPAEEPVIDDGPIAYTDVVDISFPFEEDVAVRFGDDYDDCRGSDCVRHHQSTDLMVPLNTPIHAAMGGVVEWISGSDLGPPSYGWMLRIAGDDGRSYAYVHMGLQDGLWSEAYGPGIDRGARVERGQLLGWAGCSGSASCGGGEHLHFEIHDERTVDPYDYHNHERMNPYPSLVDAAARGDYPNAKRFSDVPATSVHARSVEIFAQHGITQGCDVRRFCPIAPVTRAEMATFLNRALDLPSAPDGHDFLDVPADNVHANSIAALALSGVTRGCGGPRFCPDDAVSRQQMASFLVRALRLPSAPDQPFTDVASDNLHGSDIAALAQAGITKGCGTARFCPENPVTREEMASFIVRALELQPLDG